MKCDVGSLLAIDGTTCCLSRRVKEQEYRHKHNVQGSALSNIIVKLCRIFKGTSIKDVRFSCDFWTYLPMSYTLCTIYLLIQYLCTMSDFPSHTNLPATYPKVGHHLWTLPNQKSPSMLFFVCMYRLIICRKSLLVTILSKKFSTHQYCHVKFLFKFKSNFLKVIQGVQKVKKITLIYSQNVILCH